MLRRTYAREKECVSSMEDHIEIYNAVLSGNIDAAVNAMKKNYEKGTELLLKVITDDK
jgi:DNA-binding FadR family transcriptional regulator